MTKRAIAKITRSSHTQGQSLSSSSDRKFVGKLAHPSILIDARAGTSRGAVNKIGPCVMMDTRTSPGCVLSHIPKNMSAFHFVGELPVEEVSL